MSGSEMAVAGYSVVAHNEDTYLVTIDLRRTIKEEETGRDPVSTSYAFVRMANAALGVAYRSDNGNIATARYIFKSCEQGKGLSLVPVTRKR